MHLSFTSLRVDPWGTNREPSGIGTVLVLIFFFPCRGGELFSFGKDFAGPWGHTHGICASFCGDVDETLEHILVYCNYSESFWTEVIKWLGDQGVQIQRLSLKDILFGMFSCDDELYVNHILLLARQYLYSCRCNKKLPRIRIFIAKINIAYQLETIIAKSNVDRLSANCSKWGKYVNTLSV